MTIRDTILCEICEEKDSQAKYKCPTCRIPYCSVSCCKQHKLVGCFKKSSENESVKQSQNNQYNYPTDDTIPVERLHLLRHNKKLKDIMGNPHLRTIMESINNCKNPTNMIHEAMLEPIFVEFADECLKSFQNSED